MKTTLNKAIESQEIVSLHLRGGRIIVCRVFEGGRGFVNVESSSGAVFSVQRYEVQLVEV